MLLVDNFLIVFSLEVGGKFIGWFGLITNAIVLPLSILLLIAISIDKDLSHIRGELDEMSFGKMDFHLDTSDEDRVKQMRQSFIMGLILVIIISTIYLIASAMLIRGTTNVRNFFLNRKPLIFSGYFRETAVNYLQQETSWLFLQYFLSSHFT